MLRSFALLATLTLLITGCSSGDDAETAVRRDEVRGLSAGNTRSEVPAPDGLESFFGFVAYRYEELPQTTDLARSSVTDAGVKGTVVGFAPGPSYFEDAGPESGKNVIMTVRVADTFTGETPEPREVEVLLPSTGDATVADFLRALPAGTSTVVYLASATDLPPGEGEELMVPVSPQGFAVASREGVVYPLAHEVERAETLADQIPED